jgi:hypothetical protein
MFAYTNPNFFSLIDDIPLALNSFSTFSEDYVIPLGFNSSISGNYEIELNINNLPEIINIYIEDLSNNIVTELTNNQYFFNYNNTNSTKLFNLYFAENQTNIFDTEKSGINIYSSGKTIFVQIPDLKVPADFYLYNSVGKLVLQDKITQTNSVIEVNFASGIYLISAVINNEIVYKKVFIN